MPAVDHGGVGLVEGHIVVVLRGRVVVVDRRGGVVAVDGLITFADK